LLTNSPIGNTVPEGQEQPTIEAVKAMIRRDLNLEDDEPIADDTPLIGGEMDLDSLDILMLVTSIEKRYGVKIAGDEAGKAAFASVSTLADFIDQQAEQARSQAASSPDAKQADPAQALLALPHQPPFRFVSDMTELTPGKQGRGVWRVTGEEDFFKGHFPGHPLVPGVLICEALAQVSGVVHASANPTIHRGQLASTQVNFRAPVAPPAEIQLRSEFERTHGDLHVFVVAAESQGQVVAEGRLTLFHPAGDQASTEGAE
jgi:acyl carrier protein